MYRGMKIDGIKIIQIASATTVDIVIAISGLASLRSLRGIRKNSGMNARMSGDNVPSCAQYRP